MFEKKQKGSLKWIILIIIALVLASYFFDFNLQEAVEDEQTQSNFQYLQTHIINFYNAYLRQPINYLWNDIFIDLIWNTFTGNLENIQTGEPTTLDETAQNLGNDFFGNLLDN